LIRHWFRAGRALLAVIALLALAATPASAHVVEHAGTYTIEVGWLQEPTYVGNANAVQVTIHDVKDQPITDLAADDLKVVVTTGSQQSAELTFEPGFDPIEMEGPLGEYDAAIEPTSPGDYTFHITGSIHGTAVDITAKSGPETFDAAKDTGDLEFPVKLPTITEISTHLDRLDARTAASSAPTGPTQASVDAAAATAADAKASADRALLVGGGIGLAGLVVGAIGLYVASRRGRVSGS
jgi:hypothetical protein